MSDPAMKPVMHPVQSITDLRWCSKCGVAVVWGSQHEHLKEHDKTTRHGETFTVDLAALKAAALAATPGPWRHVHPQTDDGGHTVWQGEPNPLPMRRAAYCYTAETAAFITLASPDVVLALVAELEELRAARGTR